MDTCKYNGRYTNALTCTCTCIGITCSFMYTKYCVYSILHKRLKHMHFTNKYTHMYISVHIWQIKKVSLRNIFQYI